ncbi:MAG: hypothetical protein RIQ89_1991 [Bacteroidota bacterium]|jgi:uncharacterized protein
MMVRLYQGAISPLLPRACRYDPTCSQYMLDAVAKYGPMRGVLKGVKRILKCHPWGGHGHDPA